MYALGGTKVQDLVHFGRGERGVEFVKAYHKIYNRRNTSVKFSIRRIKKRCGDTASVLDCQVVLTKDYK